ncbi:MAG: hypothetical protein K2K93_03040 [Muribaculaceae bacterium]|nr:hypothetical protein [Muribaculaceae bacterium]
MWTIFKITNIFWLFASTYFWITALLPIGPIIAMVDLVMMIVMGLLPIKIRLDATTGWMAAAVIGITAWYTYIDGLPMGATTFLMYLPVFFLLQLPFEYKKDLLQTTIKWYAISLIPGLFLYTVTQVVSLPSMGRFVHPNYKPFLNYIFYIKTTLDFGTLERFNAYFLEPGHQALLGTFLMIADRFRFRKNPWLWVIAVAVVMSFSLAGYLLALVGFVLLKINSLGKMLATVAAVIIFVIGMQNLSGGDNAFNDLIISRLERDESQGIKGNNRFAGNTDFVFSRMMHSSDSLTGVKDKTNMDLIAGAGYKIYFINYGWIGTLLSLFFYISVIPRRPDYRYTIAFLIVLILCFFQRSYPAWYSWLFPYVMGIYIAKGEKEQISEE